MKINKVVSKNILFISYDGMTDPLGQSQVIPYMKGLSKRGYSIFILSCEKPAAYEQGKAIIAATLEGFDIKWFPVKYTKNPPVLSGLWDTQKLKSKASWIHKHYGIDLVHTRAGTPALIGLWLKEKYRIKFLNDIREFYADSRVEGGMWNIKNPLYRFIYNYFKRNENKAIEFNDGIVCLTHTGKAIITEWKEYKSQIPIEVIPCSVDLDLFDPKKIDSVEKEKFSADLGISEGDVIFSYLGSIGGWYLTDEMMQFCSMVSKKIPRAKFLFISPLAHESLKALAVKWGIPSEKFMVKHGKRAEVPVLLSLSHYSFFFIKPCYSKQSSSPTKHGEIMAMGLPVITNAGVGDVANIIKKYNSGIVLSDFSVEAFSEALKEIDLNTLAPATVIRDAANEYYSLDLAIDKYNSMYQKILG